MPIIRRMSSEKTNIGITRATSISSYPVLPSRVSLRGTGRIPLSALFGGAQVSIQFRFQAVLDHRLGQLLEQPILGQHILGNEDSFKSSSISSRRILMASSVQGISQFFGFCHFHKLLYSLMNKEKFS